MALPARDAAYWMNSSGAPAARRNDSGKPPDLKKVSIPNWILGGSFKWSTKSNDPLNAKFYIFQIQSNGSYKLVG